MCFFKIFYLQGTFYPSLTQITVQWAPPNERSRMNSIAQSGKIFPFVFATIVSNKTNVLLCAHNVSIQKKISPGVSITSDDIRILD